MRKPVSRKPTPVHNVYVKGNGGFYLKDGEATITNSIFWANTGAEITNHYGDLTVQYSCVQGGHEGTGNIDKDPLFVAAPENLRLSLYSPCVDAGTTDNAPETDILGRPRPIGPGIDMGAYEYYHQDEYIDRAHPADVNHDWIITQDEAESYLQKWQEEGAEMAVALRGAYLMKQGGKYRLIPEMEEPLCWEPQN